MNKILVTGGAGFIGLELVKKLSEKQDNEIVIIDDFSKKKEDEYFLKIIEQPNISFNRLDLSEPESYSKIDLDFDQIYHLAAIVGVRKVMDNPLLTLEVNLLSTLYLLRFISKMEKKPSILFASSCENYAGTINLGVTNVPTDENVPLCIEEVFNPRWTYASSKIVGEQAFFYYGKKYNLNVKIVRYHNVYGPRMGAQHVIPEFILRIFQRNNIFYMYGGNQYRTFCYVSDAVDMTINVMNKSSGILYNIGSEDDEILIEDLAKLLFTISNFNAEIVDKGASKGSVKRRKPDMTKLKDEKLYVHSISLRQGLEKTFNWYFKNKEILH